MLSCRRSVLHQGQAGPGRGLRNPCRTGGGARATQPVAWLRPARCPPPLEAQQAHRASYGSASSAWAPPGSPMSTLASRMVLPPSRPPGSAEGPKGLGRPVNVTPSTRVRHSPPYLRGHQHAAQVWAVTRRGSGVGCQGTRGQLAAGATLEHHGPESLKARPRRRMTMLQSAWHGQTHRYCRRTARFFLAAR